MPTIMKNGKPYTGGSGGTGGGSVNTVNGFQPDINKNVQTSRELTMEEYSALSESEKMNDMEYYVTDVGIENESSLATAIFNENENTININSITKRSGTLYDVKFTAPTSYNNLHSYIIDNQSVTLVDTMGNIIESGVWVEGSAVTLTRQGNRAFLGTGEILAKEIVDGWVTGDIIFARTLANVSGKYAYNKSLKELIIFGGNTTTSYVAVNGNLFDITQIPGMILPSKTITLNGGATGWHSDATSLPIIVNISTDGMLSLSPLFGGTSWTGIIEFHMTIPTAFW